MVINYRPQILGVRVDATDYERAVEQILNWADTGVPRYVCCACVHTVMEAHDSPNYRASVRDADLVTADGMPLVWLLRGLGARGATRVYGPTLMLRILEAAAARRIPIGFYGATENVLDRLARRAESFFPGLQIGYMEAPPFRACTEEEDETTVRAIAESGVRILFVGLGTPKQDDWMRAHRGRIQAVMVGVGAAFDFLSGTKPQAPPWMQNCGLEWLFRLATEPRRLGKRYLKHNPRFALLAAAQLIRTRTL